jgi:uncharacterized membrane protein
MTGVAFALVIGSAFLHATWNFLLKSSDHKIAFLWLIGLVGFAVLVIPAVVVGAIQGIGTTGLIYGGVSTVLHGLYGIALARSYHLGDLSKVYPIARGMGPVIVPLAAVAFLSEEISIVAGVGIALVAFGIYVIHIESGLLVDIRSPMKLLARPDTRIALVTGLLIATYSIWDTAALDHLSPITLSAFTLVGWAAVLAPLALRSGGVEHARHEWGTRRRSVVVAGIIAPLGYLMVLAALTTSQISYVAPAREIGIVLGAAMGVMLLSEGYGISRIAGAALIVAGVMTLALAP